MRLKNIEIEHSIGGATCEFTFVGSTEEANFLHKNKNKEITAVVFGSEDLFVRNNPHIPTRAKKSPKVIFNPPATILITPDGKKYVSKAHNEEFDEEKGLLMCLAKANGITHLDLKRMIKNAKRPKNLKTEGEV